MSIYYDKKPFSAKFMNFFAFIFFFGGLLAYLLYFAHQYNYVSRYKEYQLMILIAAIALTFLWLLCLILGSVLNRRKNILFDGTNIKFRVKRNVEHEFDIRLIDEMINFRSNRKVEYGYQDKMAFRFHKNEIWTTIDSSLYNKKQKVSSVQLIKDIEEAYAKIKMERVKDILNTNQGVRFRMLSLEGEEVTKEDYGNAFLDFGRNINNYSNTYDPFITNKIVVTKDAIFIGKDRVASASDGDYVYFKPIIKTTSKYMYSEMIEFYNRKGELIYSLESNLIVNSEFFKMLTQSIFRRL